MAVMSALLGFTSERRWLRYADKELAGMFPRTIGQSGWNKRVRKAFFLFIRVIRMLAMDTSLWSDDVRVVDSTPVQCGCSRETVKRSDAAGWAEYGYCASHSRYFWGLRLHLVCTLTGLPVMFALAGAKADERETLLGMLEAARDVTAAHPGQVIIGDKNYFGRAFEAELTERELTLLRPVRKGGGQARRAEPVQAAAPGHRVRQLDLQGAARPGTPRRQDPRGHPRPRPGPGPRADRRDLAQRQNRPACHEILDRLRPLTVTSPLGIIHLGRPCGPSHAIGYADPRPGSHSPG